MSVAHPQKMCSPSTKDVDKRLSPFLHSLLTNYGETMASSQISQDTPKNRNTHGKNSEDFYVKAVMMRLRNQDVEYNTTIIKYKHTSSMLISEVLA
jgi:hypothetical protein